MFPVTFDKLLANSKKQTQSAMFATRTGEAIAFSNEGSLIALLKSFLASFWDTNPLKLTHRVNGEHMCLHPESISPVPEVTARVAKAAFPRGNRYLRLRDELGVFYNDEEFAELYPERGHPALAPWRLTMILIMQFLENLSDRQTADAVRGRIDWKYALSLELEDEGFDFSVLSEFRDCLIGGGKEKQNLDKMLSQFVELGFLKSRGKARTDATHILAAVKELTRLEHLEETLKSALNTLAASAPTWLEKILTPEFYERYGQKGEHSKKTQTVAEKEAKAITIGTDGFYLLDAIYTETTPNSIPYLGAFDDSGR